MKTWHAALALATVLMLPRLWAAEPMRVAVSIPPQAGLLQHLAGERVVVDTLVGAGQNPHSYEPTARQLARLSECAVLFTLGMPFERSLLPRLSRSHPALRVVRTDEGFGAGPASDHAGAPAAAPRPEAQADAGCCGQGHGHNHRHGHDEDPHLWVAPAGILHQARQMTAVLVEIDPEHASEHRDSLQRFTARVEALDASFRERFAPHRGQTFLVYHPAWGHFAQAYGLRQRAVERHGVEPGARHLATLVEEARAAKVRGVLVQSDAEARRVRPLSDPLALRVHLVSPLEADPIRLLEFSAEAIAQSLPAIAPPTPE